MRGITWSAVVKKKKATDINVWKKTTQNNLPKQVLVFETMD